MHIYKVFIQAIATGEHTSTTEGRIFSYADEPAIVFGGTTWDTAHNFAREGLTDVAAWLDNILLTQHPTTVTRIAFSVLNWPTSLVLGPAFLAGVDAGALRHSVRRSVCPVRPGRGHRTGRYSRSTGYSFGSTRSAAVRAIRYDVDMIVLSVFGRVRIIVDFSAGVTHRVGESRRRARAAAGARRPTATRQAPDARELRHRIGDTNASIELRIIRGRPRACQRRRQRRRRAPPDARSTDASATRWSSAGRGSPPNAYAPVFDAYVTPHSLEHCQNKHRRHRSISHERTPAVEYLETRRRSEECLPASEQLSRSASIKTSLHINRMATLSLKISLNQGEVVKTMQFDPSTTVYDACKIIREKILEASTGDPKDYGLFLTSDEDTKKGIWLEPSRTLDYYILRNGDVLEYNRKLRNLRVRMLDGTVKTLLVDDSQIVANLMVVICTKIGITNYDEYGLVREEPREEPDPCEKPNYGTLTLKRKHQDKERDIKMEQLRKKLRTDDEVNWVEPSKTLREQGIDVAETLLLRRKFFFSDRNVDSRDPVQLNLLYVQARDAILDGTHPVTQDKACEFAGIQCQIQFGDHKEDKHTAGFLDLKEFLPASYVKVKGIEKKVFKEHKRHAGLSELDAKVLYTKSARSLKTYGVAFFLVKEKMKGKNKLVPRLLGVTKDSVLRLDEKTKEILQTWPLTTVRRWCASPNTFTLDFGDYSDQYYSVQTTEAEQILQVIAGYIDIILKKQRAKDHLGIEGDEGSAMVEDSVSPSKANIIQHDTFKSGKVVNTESVAKPAVLRPGAEGAKPFAVGHMTGAQQTTVSGQIITGHTSPAASQVQQTKVTSLLTEPQRALLTTITTGREIIKQTEEGLTRATLPELGRDAASVKWKQSTMDTSKQAVTSQIAAMNAATAQVVTLTSGPTEEVDHTAVGAAITTITTNLPEMTKGVQMIAALMDDTDNGDRLLDATRKLCFAFSDLLRAAEPETKEPRQNLLNAASRVGEASTSVLYTIGDDAERDKETQVIAPPTSAPSTASKKSYLYRKLNYCYDNFYKVFFGSSKDKEYGSDFDQGRGEVKKEYDDEGLYEEIDVTKPEWYNHLKTLDVIQEESDSDYYRSLEYASVPMTIHDINQGRSSMCKIDEADDKSLVSTDFESILENCEEYLDSANQTPAGSPRLLPRNNVSDKIYNFKKDFSNHDYANINFDPTPKLNKYKTHNYENVNIDRKTKNDLLRERFFLSNAPIDKNLLNEEFNKRKNCSPGKTIECHSIENHVTRTGPDVKVSGALNIKFLNDLEKYNRVLTTKETFTEGAIASFTKSELSKLNKRDDFENFVKKSEKYYTTESFERETTVTLNNARGDDTKPRTEIRIFYNPTFRATGSEPIRGFCSYCRRRCPRSDLKCCERCECLETELKEIWRENWLNILLVLGLLFMLLALLVQAVIPKSDLLLSLAKAVANTTAALVLKAKNVAATCKDDPPAQNAIIAAATHCALATSQLVACAKVVAPTLHNAACRSQLESACRQVASAVERLLGACAGRLGVDELAAAAQKVTDALEALLAHTDIDRRAQPTVTETKVETVMTHTERLVSAGDPAEMVRQARLLGQATAHLITDIKTEAERQPSETQRKLLAAAKLLADATARMVEAARRCASSPQDREKQEALRRAAEELRYITVDYAQGQDIVGSQVARLQDTAREAAASATQLITSAQNAAVYNTNKYSQETLLSECKTLSEQLPRLADATAAATARPGRAAAQLELITASEAFLQPSGHVAQAARAVLPTVSDASAAKRLGDTTHQFTTSCADLRSAVSRARISCKGLELDAAAELIRSLRGELDDLEEAARAFELRPLPGQTPEWASSTLTSSSRAAASATAQLVSATRLRDAAGAGRSGGELASSLRDFTGGLRAATAHHTELEDRDRVISSGRQVVESSLTLVETVKTYLTTSEQVDISHIASIARDISHGLERTASAAGSQRELEHAVQTVDETLHILNSGEFPPSDRTYGELQSELSAAAAALHGAGGELVHAVERPAGGALPDAGRHFGDAFNGLLGVALEMTSQTEDRETRATMVNSMKSVTVASSKLLHTAKSVSQDLTRPNAKNELMAAARALTDAINRLVDVFTEGAPGQKECDTAIRSIQSTRPLLNAPTQPLSELGYFGCLDAIVDQSKSLSEGMSGMASAAKRSAHEQFGRSVHTVADAVCGLVECTAQAAYLVAVSDETSVAGRPGLVDQAQFARAAHAIDAACRALADPHTDQQQVLSAATVIAKHTSALCNACRVASGKTGEPQAKRHFVQAAKDVANSTAALVKEIKALDSDYSESNRSRCAVATGPLLDAVRGLCQFADSPEFASVPAKISAQARRSQEAILDCGRSIINGSCSMIESAKVLAVQPADKPQWQALATHSKTVSDSIKSLVNNIREKAPGQRECAAALDTINKQLRELDRAAIAAVGQQLQPRTTNTLQGFTEQMENSSTELAERLEPLRVAALGEAENLGHSVVQLVSYVEPLVGAGIGAASHITESVTQATVLDRTKTVLEGLAQLVQAAKDAGGNPRATSVHPAVEEQCLGVRAALSELAEAAREVSSQRGAVGPLLDAVARSVARLTSHRPKLIYLPFKPRRDVAHALESLILSQAWRCLSIAALTPSETIKASEVYSTVSAFSHDLNRVSGSPLYIGRSGRADGQTGCRPPPRAGSAPNRLYSRRDNH
ncbi:Talin-2 [Eumeta japonica]|uniref:Talin-2 n=1 Tax=Eumeta variegata TaxID=151549 RepID=A0A4C1XQ45_EUMVA|nr:Talin-2 [Eumeta japonica]